MGKERQRIPRQVRDEVEREFNHRCAVCGADRPQLHHIDKNPVNNDPKNLIPLCPNCHLTDQHNPTEGLDPGILRLFRLYKDPAILTPQFHPLYMRLRFLEGISNDSDAKRLWGQALELVDFVAALNMGAFYAKEMNKLVRMPPGGGCLDMGDPESERRYRLAQQERAKKYLEQLRGARDRLYVLAVELLRYQEWKLSQGQRT